MKSSYKYIILIVVYLGLMILASILSPKEVNWTPSYSNSDKIPFGSEVLYDRLGDIFPNQNIYETDRTIYETEMDRDSSARVNLIFVANNLNLDFLDYEVLMDQIDRGSSVFISSNYMDLAILDTLGIYTNTSWSGLNFLEDSLNVKKNEALLRLGSQESADSSYTIKATSRSVSYFNLDDANGGYDVLGTLQEGEVIFIRIPYGDGDLFLHTHPLAFTNYHMLQEDTHPYLSACLSVLPIQETIWDEYYKVSYGNGTRKSKLHILLRNPGMRWAWYLFLTAGFLYVLFFSKRTQRAIPIVKPYTNTTVEYTRTIGSMYFECGSPADILNKRMLFFKDFVARKYYVRDIDFTQEEAVQLATKAAFPEEKMKKLFNIMRNLSSRTDISDGQLLVATQRLNEFYRLN